MCRPPRRPAGATPPPPPPGAPQRRPGRGRRTKPSPGPPAPHSSRSARGTRRASRPTPWPGCTAHTRPPDSPSASHPRAPGPGRGPACPPPPRSRRSTGPTPRGCSLEIDAAPGAWTGGLNLRSGARASRAALLPTVDSPRSGRPAPHPGFSPRGRKCVGRPARVAHCTTPLHYTSRARAVPVVSLCGPSRTRLRS